MYEDTGIRDIARRVEECMKNNYAAAGYAKGLKCPEAKNCSVTATERTLFQLDLP